MRLSWIMVVLIGPTASAADLPVNTNVFAASEDAFGTTLGPESLGLYNAGSVRGFNPLSAGNGRINGLYFDQQGQMVDRLANDTRIRVGLSAVDFPWPAPTGIVDYTFRQPKDVPGATALFHFGPYDSREVDLDGYTKLWGERAGLAAGASFRNDTDIPGLTARVTSFGVLPQWTPDKNLTVNIFWGRRNVTDANTLPIIYVATGRSPPHLPRRYFGQPWTRQDIDSEHYGGLATATLSEHWSLRAGLFRSISDSPRAFSDLYVDTSSEGLGRHLLIAGPDQYYASTSGEIQLSHVLRRKRWEHKLDLGIRGRDVSALYGGSDGVDLGVGTLGQPVSAPHFVLGTRTVDRIHEYSVGASYSFRWGSLLSFIAGIQRPNYSRHVQDPALGNSTSILTPWLYNSSITLRPTKRLTLFGTLTRGLEDSGIAPLNAINRGAILGATRSSQEEIGMKYLLTPSLKLVAAAFDIHKPYFALDGHGLFGNLGSEQHRGVEVSLAGELTHRLTVIAGVTFLTPKIEATASPQEPIGTRPVGLASRMGQLNLDYHTPWLPGLSVDCVFSAHSARTASVDNRTRIAGYGTLDLGARYLLPFNRRSVTLRVQVLNVTSAYNWYVESDGGLLLLEPRRAWAYLTVDL